MGICKHIPWNEMGFEVVANVGSGAEAFNQFMLHEPAVVLTDIRMEGMNGLELMREIRKHNANTKFVILSGYNDFEYARQSIVYGVSAYLLKPTKTFEFREVFRKIKQELDEQILISRPKVIPTQVSHGGLQHAIEFIEAHYMDKITLSLAAEKAFMSSTYFSKLFKQQIGMTFIEYLTDIRIAKAMDLLTYTNNKVIDVAVMVGYDDFRHFCKIFKNKIGKSPKRFQEHIRHENANEHSGLQEGII